MNTILIVAPHPDDEIIGAGGLMAKAISRGKKVHVLYLSSGDSIETTREKEAEEVCAFMGVTGNTYLRLKGADFAVTPETKKRVIDVFTHVRPDLIYINHELDADFEHKIAYQLVAESFWRYNMQAEKAARGLILYEVHKPMQTYSIVENISQHIDTKMQAMSFYRSQLSMARLDLAIRGLNQYRGLLHEGCDFAEVFQMKRFTGILDDFAENKNEIARS